MSKFRFPRLTLIFVGLIALLLIVVPVRATAGPGIAETDDDEILGGPWGRWGGPDTPDWVVADGAGTQCQEKQEYGATKCWQKYTFGYSQGRNLMPPEIIEFNPDKQCGEGYCLFGCTGVAVDYDGTIDSIFFIMDGQDKHIESNPYDNNKNTFSANALRYGPGKHKGMVIARDNDGLFGSRIIELSVTDENGSDNDNPVISFLSVTPETGPPPLTINIEAHCFARNSYVDEWRVAFGDNSMPSTYPGSTDINLSHTFDTPGVYNFSVTVVDNNGRLDTRVKTVVVTSTNSLPVGSRSAGLPGMVMEWTHPGGEVQRWFLPLDSSGTTDEGIFWTTALGSSYSVTTVKFDWVIPESLQASLADGDHRWTTWLVDSEGKKSNKRYFYYTVGAGATAAAVKPAAGELTFNLLASTYANESLTPQYGTVEVYANGALAETKDITFGQVSLTVTPGIDSQWIFKIIDNDPRTVRLNWVNGQLKIYYDAQGETPVDYYQAEDGSYYLEYWAPNLYICGPHDDYGPIIGRWWVRRD